MKTFLAILLLSLALNLVSGNEVSELEDRSAMNISETRKCYVYGQCQEYSLDFKVTQDPEGCHKFCGKNNECNWWSWEPAFELCMLFANCTDVGIDPPAVEPCPDCISGESECPARECHGAFKCKGDFVDSFAISTLEECIEKCNEVEDCQWFTLEKSNDHCILYEECDDQFDCETCASGEKKCAHGYKGTTPASTTPVTTTAARSDSWVFEVDWEIVDSWAAFGPGAPGYNKPLGNCWALETAGSPENKQKCWDLHEEYNRLKREAGCAFAFQGRIMGDGDFLTQEGMEEVRRCGGPTCEGHISDCDLQDGQALDCVWDIYTAKTGDLYEFDRERIYQDLTIIGISGPEADDLLAERILERAINCVNYA